MELQRLTGNHVIIFVLDCFLDYTPAPNLLFSVFLYIRVVEGWVLHVLLSSETG